MQSSGEHDASELIFRRKQITPRIECIDAETLGTDASGAERRVFQHPCVGHDAVTAMRFRVVKRSVGALQDAVDLVAWFVRRDPGTEGEVQGVLVKSKLRLFYLLSHPVQNACGNFFVGIGQ